jgi:hypothetical protein
MADKPAGLAALKPRKPDLFNETLPEEVERELYPQGLEAARRASLRAIDNEFINEVQTAMGPMYRNAVNPRRARLAPSADPNFYGFTIPEGYSDESVERIRFDQGPDMWGRPLESGYVYARGAENATPRLWAHEFTHLADPDLSEDTVRLLNARNANIPSAWDRGIKGWKNVLENDIYSTEDALAEAEFDNASPRRIEYLKGRLAELKSLAEDPEIALIEELRSYDERFSALEQGYDDKQKVRTAVPTRKRFMGLFEYQPALEEARMSGGDLEAPWNRWAREKEERDKAAASGNKGSKPYRAGGSVENTTYDYGKLI